MPVTSNLVESIYGELREGDCVKIDGGWFLVGNLKRMIVHKRLVVRFTVRAPANIDPDFLYFGLRMGGLASTKISILRDLSL